MTAVKKQTKWSDDLYVQISDFAKMGMSDTKIEAALGLSRRTLDRWKKERPALERIIIKARNGHRLKQAGTQPTFFEYIENRLPDELRDAWYAVMHIDSDPNGIRRVEKHIQRMGTHARQHIFVHALVKSNFNAAEACRITCIPYSTFMQWKDGDPDFVSILDNIHLMKKDFFENCLIEGCRAGEPAAYIFANKTFNADRFPSAPVKVETNVTNTGEVVHVHKIEELDLPVELMQVMLDKMKEKNVTVIDVPMIEQGESNG